jgi:hypothetical protein
MQLAKSYEKAKHRLHDVFRLNQSSIAHKVQRRTGKALNQQSEVPTQRYHIRATIFHDPIFLLSWLNSKAEYAK